MVGLVLAAAVGAACAVPNRPAAVVRAAVPDTPVLSEQQGIYGKVRIVVTVAADGSVTGLRVVESPSAILNGAALSAARRSTYRPALQHCAPVQGEYLLSVNFSAPALRVELHVSPRGEKLAVASVYAVVFRVPELVSVNAVVITSGATETAALAADEDKFRWIVSESSGIATARTIVGPLKMTPGKSTWNPTPNEPTPAPSTSVLREIGLSVENLDDVRRAVKVLEPYGSVEAWWSLRDPSGAQREALAVASRYARTNVEAFARKRGLRVVAVRKVRLDTSPSPYVMMTHPDLDSGRTPYVRVERDLTVTYLLGR
jgi:TonB family protein